jgi:UDP-N-acetyl-D-mannosaminuronic acid dehydrogenase
VSAKVAVVGFGYVGSCIGAVLAGKKYRVTGIDTRSEVIEMIRRGESPVNEPGLHDLISQGVADGYLHMSADFGPVEEAEVIILTVGTPIDDGEPDTSQVEVAASQVATHLREGQLVILKSTVPPFTTERVVRPILESSGLEAGNDFHLAFCPERLAEGRALHELQVLPIVVGGINEASTERAAEFWEEALGLETIRVANARTAELSKLADNWWIDMSIAMGNELALLCDQLGVDVLEVINAANSLPKGKHHVNILLPSVGVGGSCLTKDPWFVHHLAASRGLELKLPATGRTVNEAMPAHTFRLIAEELATAGKSLEESTVAVLGLSFKDNTGDTRLTPAKEVLEMLEASGCSLRVFDPLVSGEDAAQLTEVEPSKHVGDALQGADCVAFLTGHDEFRRMSIRDIAGQVNPGCTIIDGRMYFTRDQIEEMGGAGLRYRGIGR